MSASGRFSTRDANTACRRRPSGSTTGNAPTASRWGMLSAAGSSSSANGLPCASAISRRRTRGAIAGNRSSSSAAAETSSSGFTSCPGTAPCPKKLSSPVRDAASKPTRLPARRRATNPSTTALARSNHGTSSTTTSNGCDADAWRRRFNAALQVTSRSAAGPSAKPNATPNARAWSALQSVRTPEKRLQKLIERGEAHVGLELSSPSPHHPHAHLRRVRRGDVQQDRLAYAGVPPQLQCTTLNRRIIDEGANDGDVDRASNEGRRLSARAPPSSMAALPPEKHVSSPRGTLSARRGGLSPRRVAGHVGRGCGF